MPVLELVVPLILVAPLFLLGPFAAWLFARRGRLKLGAVANTVPPLGVVVYWHRYVADPGAFDFPTAVVVIQILYWLCAAGGFLSILFVVDSVPRGEVFWIGWGINLSVLASVLVLLLYFRFVG